ncbi:type I polyketide synthase [Actinomadura sp. KC216]|uniref:type I polyketide synthase n=1 Tax=Actinomadura sp. KC216 TaxID=2530370 RepID=UPI001405325D|nr:type I polyketide synthase [Actinomadura sp. KC216]
MEDWPEQIPLAIVGLGAIMPGATDVRAFWADIVTGRDLISDVPDTHWLVEDFYDPDPGAPDKTYCRRGGFLPMVEFDPARFGIPPSKLSAIDTAQLLGLVAAEKVLDDVAAGRGGTPDGERTSVILGSAALQLLGEMAMRLERPHLMRAMRDSGIPADRAAQVCERVEAQTVPWQEATFPGLLSNVVAGRIANRFDLHGTNCTTDAACAGSLSALSMAADELSLGKADMVITGGVDTLTDPFSFVCFSKTPALSPTGDIRPFAADADGTILGEGVALLAVRRLADAERDGDRVYAVIRGVGSSSDGRGASIFSPVAAGQERALRRAYQAAGYGPGTVELVEAHGTGTPAGDAAEFAALRQVFDESGREDRRWCALGTVKSQIGHTKAAAGAAGLLKAVLALHHKVLPPTIKAEQPNPRLEIAGSPFYLSTSARPWINLADHPRRASVSSFGFGGSNFHVALEEYPAGKAPRLRAAPTEVVPVSAGDAAALAHRLRDLAGDLDSSAEPLAAVARRAQSGFRPDEGARLAVVASDASDLARKLAEAADLVERRPGQGFSTPAGIHFEPRPPAGGGIGFLFPGQGSQYLAMGADLAMHFAPALHAWERASRLGLGDRALSQVVFPAPAGEDERAAQAERLTATEWAQPALAVHGLVLLGLLRDLGVRPDALAGHSFGELVALHAAGVVGADDLVRLARRRGELMRAAADRPGAMAAVPAPGGDVEAVLADMPGAQVWIANRNAPSQTVVSGTAEGVAPVMDRFPGARRLSTSAAFHSPLVAAAVRPFREHLDGVEMRPPGTPVYAGADATLFPGDAGGIRDRVARQLAAPVLFADVVRAMYDAGVRTFVEVGPGAVLTGLVREIVPDECVAIETDRHGRHGVTALHDAVARLAVRGVAVDFEALWRDQPPPDVPAGGKRSTMTVPICGANHGRPYPKNVKDHPAPPSRPPQEPSMPQPADVPPPAIGSEERLAWLAALQQESTRAHATFQRTLSESYARFLELTQATVAAMAAEGAAVPIVAPAAVPTDTPTAVPADTPTAVPADTPAVVPPVAPPAERTGSEVLPAPDEVAGAVTVPVEPPPSAGPPNLAELEERLVSVVAERTGFPREVIGMDMDIEAQLGVDSITRVQILADTRSHFPELEARSRDDLAELLTLTTLNEIKEAIHRLIEGEPAPAAAAPAGAPAGDPEEEPERLIAFTAAEPAPGAPMPGLGEGTLALADGGSGVAEPLREMLDANGIAALVCDPARQAPPVEVTGLIHLGGLREHVTADEALEVQKDAFATARTLAQRMGDGGVFVTVQDTGGGFGLDGATTEETAPDRALLGGIAALARTARREWPEASVKAIDCARGDRASADVAAAILAELLEGGATPDVGLRATGERVAIGTAPAPLPRRAGPPLRDGQVIIVTGGARGITAAAVKELARSCKPRLLLLGRTPVQDGEPADLPATAGEAELIRLLHGRAPGSTPAELAARARRVMAAREVRATIDDLAATGATVRYEPVDVRDAGAVTEVVAAVRADWGPITGLVHGAGVLADARIADKTDDQFDLVFNTKIGGLRALLAATRDDPLELLLVFSSVSAAMGNAGQCDYAMANETMGHLLASERLRRPGCRMRALAWGPWDGGMVTPPLAEHFRRLGVPLIGRQAGVRAFLAELGHDGPEQHVMLCTRGTPARAEEESGTVGAER